MNEKEKYRTEIDATLLKFGETINEMKAKRELRNERLKTLFLGILRQFVDWQTWRRNLSSIFFFVNVVIIF